MAASTYNPLARPTPAPIRMSELSSPLASPLFTLGYRLCLLYIFVMVGRISEVASAFLGTSLYQIAVMTLLLLPVALVTGVLMKVGANRIGMFWIGFHLWVMLTLPLSGYRSGSLEVFIGLMKLLPITLFVGGFLIQNKDTLRRGMWAMAWAGIAALAWMQQTRVDDGDERYASIGTFGNSNQLAIYLLVMIPFWGAIAVNPRYRWITRLFFCGAIVLALITDLRTGSRSGLLAIGLLAIPVFFSLNLANKAKFVVLATAAVIAALAWMPEGIKTRLSTVFTQKVTNEITIGAIASSEARYALLIESLETTMKHPFFGTGLGVYSSVAAREKEEKGERAHWQVTHNMYTEISAESGIPGFILYMTALVLAIREAWRVKNKCKDDPDLYELGLFAKALLFSYMLYCFSGFFTSMATDFPLYTLVGFSIALSFVCQQMLNQKALVNSAVPAASASTIAHPRPSRFFPSGITAATPQQDVPTPEVAVANADAPWRRNPRKFPPSPGTPSR